MMTDRHENEPLADHIERLVDSAPPLTAEQRDRLATLLRPGGGFARPVSEESRRRDEEERKRRELAERQTRDAERISRAVLACAICGVPRFVHDKEGRIEHGWVPGAVDRVVSRLAAGEPV